MTREPGRLQHAMGIIEVYEKRKARGTNFEPRAFNL